jgi:hypothetical protein
LHFSQNLIKTFRAVIVGGDADGEDIQVGINLRLLVVFGRKKGDNKGYCVSIMSGISIRSIT